MGYTKKRTFGLSSILAILATVVMLMKELSSRSNFFLQIYLIFHVQVTHRAYNIYVQI